MKPLVLTSLSGAALMRADFADQVIMFTFRFVWGKLPSLDDLVTYVAPWSEMNGPGEHWSDFAGRWRRDNGTRGDLGLIEFCRPYETIELWFDPQPNDQLQLIWLLDLFRSHPETSAKIKLRLIGFELITIEDGGPDEKNVRLVNVSRAHIETASRCWRAYRAPTPEPCFD